MLPVIVSENLPKERNLGNLGTLQFSTSHSRPENDRATRREKSVT